MNLSGAVTSPALDGLGVDIDRGKVVHCGGDTEVPLVAQDVVHQRRLAGLDQRRVHMAEDSVEE